ncbi:MAG: alpha/beta fold hydrolase [Anaerolineales bacterium]
MQTLLTIIKWILAGLVGLLLLLVIGSTIYHRLRIPSEEVAYPPPGQLVAVNGHRLHVYAEGTGDLTLVFFSGSGTTAPALDFKGLYCLLSDNYRTVVVERAGYGWSDEGGTSRDIETVLNETRQALTSAGESPPYVLLPHSMGALEAIHWANRHPKEVTAIIGLDPAVPPIYEIMPSERMMVAVASFIGRTGLLRLAPSICLESPAASYLTEAEMSAYCSIMVRRTLTADMRAEVEAVQANARRVAAEGMPDVPFYALISNGDGVPVDSWREVLAAYVEAAGGQYKMLDVGHHLYAQAPHLIAKDIRAFLQEPSDSVSLHKTKGLRQEARWGGS